MGIPVARITGWEKSDRLRSVIACWTTKKPVDWIRASRSVCSADEEVAGTGSVDLDCVEQQDGIAHAPVSGEQHLLQEASAAAAAGLIGMATIPCHESKNARSTITGILMSDDFITMNVPVQLPKETCHNERQNGIICSAAKNRDGMIESVTSFPSSRLSPIS
jgi:hypothetical protein